MGVLVVEDNAAVRLLSVRTLQAAGYAVLQAASAEEALQLSKTCAISLLLTDIHLGDGGMDGFALVDLITREHPGLPVVMMSGQSHNGPLAVEKGLVFLAKPFLPSSMVECVRSALRGFDDRNEAARGPGNI